MNRNQNEVKWDKTFKKSDKVNVSKVHFHNRYGIELAGDLYTPIEYHGQLAAITVCGPFGAVKEQAAGLYAQELAKLGFIALAFDPSFIGESGGNVRNVASPDINTEDVSASIDFLANLDIVDSNKLGVLGICGFGGMALNAAQIDTRIKASVIVTMYDMSRVISKGYFDLEDTTKDRLTKKIALNNQRVVDYKTNEYKLAGGVNDVLADDAPQFVKDYYAYYKTERGYHPRSLNSNKGWNVTSALSFINMPILNYLEEIESAVLLIHGEKAHSLYFSKDVYKHLKGQNKELLIIKDANHVDLYDDLNKIPLFKIKEFYENNLK